LRDIWIVQQIVLPALDVLLLSFLIYRGYQILLETRAVQLFRGALFLGGLYAVSFFLNLRTLLWLINLLAPSFVIGVAIIFQPELRKIFTKIGQGRWLQAGDKSRPQQVEEVLTAGEELSRQRRGALIVFARVIGLKDVIDTEDLGRSTINDRVGRIKRMFDWAVSEERLIVVTGPVFKNSTKTIGGNEVGVPDYFYKVVMDVSPPHYKAIGFIMKHEKGTKELYEYAVTVDEVEDFTGLDFFEALPDSSEQLLEQNVQLSMQPTCEEMHNVPLPDSGIYTVSTALPPRSLKSHLTQPSEA